MDAYGRIPGDPDFEKETNSREDFDAWKDNSVTETVLAAVQAIADGARDEWLQASWQNDVIDPAFRAALKAKERLALDLVDMEYEDLTAWQHEPGRRLRFMFFGSVPVGRGLGRDIRGGGGVRSRLRHDRSLLVSDVVEPRGSGSVAARH